MYIYLKDNLTTNFTKYLKINILLLIMDVCLPDEAGNVDINKCCHEVLTVKPIHNATMTRDSVGKILKAQKTVQYFKYD